MTKTRAPLSGASETPLGVALLGCGTVGSEVARLLIEQAADLEARVGRRLELVGIAVRRAGRERPGIDPALFTTDADALVARPEVDLVIEVIGGIEPARGLILQALGRGAAVVTANKALLAEDGVTLFEAAAESRRRPLLRGRGRRRHPDHPAAARIAGRRRDHRGHRHRQRHHQLHPRQDGQHRAPASPTTLAEAQELGYAEADPTADVEGFDAAAKAAILASLAFHTRVTAADVYREGITEITSADIASAREIGCVVKLLALCQLSDSADGSERIVSVRVHPAMIPRSHPLASVGGAYNAVFVESRSAGRLMFYGPGAGGSPTASAVLGDLVTVARNRVRGATGPGESSYAARPVSPIGGVATRYHLSLEVADVAGVLARIAQVFAEHDVSIQTVRQNGRGDEAQLVDRHPPRPRLRAQRHRRGAARSRRRTRGDQRDAGRGRMMDTGRDERQRGPATGGSGGSSPRTGSGLISPLPRLAAAQRHRSGDHPR